MATTVADDGNVLARFILCDDARQYEAVMTQFAAVHVTGGSVLVGDVVVAELAWMLRTSYGFSRDVIAAVVRDLLAAPLFVLRSRAVVEQALTAYETGPADFSDYLIAATALAEGAEALLTFDRDILKHPLAKRP